MGSSLHPGNPHRPLRDILGQLFKEADEGRSVKGERGEIEEEKMESLGGGRSRLRRKIAV
jgi:hypothetical protein